MCSPTAGDERADQSGLVRSTGRYQTLDKWVVETQALMPKSQSTACSEPSEQEHKTGDETCIMQSDTCAQLHRLFICL